MDNVSQWNNDVMGILIVQMIFQMKEIAQVSTNTEIYLRKKKIKYNQTEKYC